MDAVRSELAAVRRFAALSGPFEPVQALRAIGGDVASLGADKLTLISAGLAQSCERTAVDAGERWLMRGSERRHELEAIGEDSDPTDSVAEAVAWRQRSATDEQTTDLLDALLGEGRFTRDRLSRMLREADSPEVLASTAEALERAGALAPQHNLLPQVRAALTRAGLRVNRQSVLDGFVGRHDELAIMREWASQGQTGRTTSLYVQGLPGIGKSTLLEATAAQLVEESPDWIVVRLDFDRTGLDVQDWQGLTLELSRQVAAQVDPVSAELLSQAREAVIGTTPLDVTLKGRARQRVHPQLGSALNNVVSREQRRVLVLLDTLEVLRSRGETQPAQLFDWLDDLAGYRVPLTVITAGRGEALSAARDREARTVMLMELDPASAEELLANLGVAPRDFDRVRRSANGNPLALRLAAKIAKDGHAESLGDARGDDSFTAARLYRFLLSRVDDEDLKRLANPGLVVRVIDPEVIREVLAPAVGLGDVSNARAEELFERLASQHWLVQPDAIAPGFVRHRADMRAELLPLLYKTSAPQCAEIDRRAARWFAQRPEAWAGLEAAYHRLQVMRRDPRVPAVDPGTLGQLDEQTLEELPAIAQDLVLRTRGHRTTGYRGVGPESPDHGSAEPRPLDPGAVAELRSIIERGDWMEGGYVYDAAFRDAVFDARSPEADVARTYLWRAGRWTEAQRLLRERDGLGADDTDLLQVPESRPHEVACRLEMRAELQFDDLVAAFRRNEELAALAANLLSLALHSSLGDGALRLAVEEVEAHGMSSPSQVDPAGAAAAWWGGHDAGEAADPRVEEAAGWSRISSRVGADHPPRGTAGRARMLAALTPYGDLVAVMTAGQRPEVLAFLDHALAGVHRLGLLSPGDDDWYGVEASESESGGLNALADVGLLAEAVGAAGYVLRDADLNLVARSAERWRRTMAGAWSYGSARSRHRGWNRAVDISIAERAEELARSDDPVARSREQLDAWCDPGQGHGSALDLVRRRAVGSVARARTADDAAAACRILLGRFVPSAFVPGLSVLIRQGATPERQTRRRGRKDQR